MNNTTLSNATNTLPSSSCVASQPLDKTFRAVLYSLLIAMSIFGNTLVIYVVVKNKRMHTVANYLICNMSIADLLITFLPMVWEIVKLMHYSDGTWPMGSFMCSFVFMCIYLSVACSILSLTTITFDRFFAIMFPMKSIMTKRLLPFLLIAIWLASTAFASPMIYAQKLKNMEGKLYCSEMWDKPFDANESPKHYTIILFVSLYAIPLLIMAVLYTAIGTKLWKRNIPGNRSAESDQYALKQKKKVIKMLITIVLLFAICWFPIFLAQFLFFFSPHYLKCPGAFPQWFQFFALFLQYLSSAVNPYVYFTYSQSFRRGAAQAFRRTRFFTRQVTVVESTGVSTRATGAFTMQARETRASKSRRTVAFSEQIEN